MSGIRVVRNTVTFRERDKMISSGKESATVLCLIGWWRMEDSDKKQVRIDQTIEELKKE